MIDLFTVFHKGGAVLFRHELTPVPDMPVDGIINRVLLENRASVGQAKHGAYTVKWVLDNALDLVVVTAFLTMARPSYVDALLVAARDKFAGLFRAELAQRSAFTPTLPTLVAGQVCPPASAFASFAAEYAKMVAYFEKSEAASSAPAAGAVDKGPAEGEDPAAHAARKAKAEAERLAAVERKFGAKGGGRHVYKGKKKKGGAAGDDDEGKKSPREKKATVWGTGGASSKDQAAFDRSAHSNADQSAVERATLAKARAEFGEAPRVGDSYASDSDEEDTAAHIEAATARAARSSGGAGGGDEPGVIRGMFSFFEGLSGQKVLQRKELAPVLDKFKDSLMGKNVAVDIADKLCESVMANLEGKKMASMTTVTATVKAALTDALAVILTPKKNIDVLQGVMAARAQGRPYTIVFVGVNGVGKSTSLSKVCAYLMSKGCTTSIAACDTFRSGAVEQLRTHAKCLGVELFEQGYNKDAASVAREAIAQAGRNGDDVVLVDTAGRMQDNKPLMRSLSKLINMNKPDLILFVGEALAGNDSVDQLTKFNGCLEDLAVGDDARLIDGIVLTKFDTVDDKVGSAISMTYATGQPIVFVGTGQTYRDLKKMNVRMLISKLMA